MLLQMIPACTRDAPSLGSIVSRGCKSGGLHCTTRPIDFPRKVTTPSNFATSDQGGGAGRSVSKSDPEMGQMSKYFTLWSEQYQREMNSDTVVVRNFITAAKNAQFDTMVCSVTIGDLLSVKGDEVIVSDAPIHAAVREACTQGLEVVVVVDFFRANPHLLEQFSEDLVTDADGRTYQSISTGSTAFLDLVEKILRLLARSYRIDNSTFCVRALSPNFNNELETRFAQEYDSFQDYSGPMIAKYRHWLETLGDIAFFNARWQKTHRGFEDVLPPRLASAGRMLNLAEWDWQEFREVYISRVVERCCEIISSEGYRCFLHFAESYTSLDAISTVPFFKLMRSPHVHEVAVDTNFVTFQMKISSADVAGLLVSMTAAYDKLVYFEAAVERYRDRPNEIKNIIHRSFRKTAACGGAHLSVTNVLDAEDFALLMPFEITELRQTPRKPQAVLFSPYMSYYSCRKELVENSRGNTHHVYVVIVFVVSFHDLPCVSFCPAQTVRWAKTACKQDCWMHIKHSRRSIQMELRSLEIGSCSHQTTSSSSPSEWCMFPQSPSWHP